MAGKGLPPSLFGDRCEGRVVKLLSKQLQYFSEHTTLQEGAYGISQVLHPQSLEALGAWGRSWAG